MILLLGGTTETPRIANLLSDKKIEVLISNLTDSTVNWDLNTGIRFRHGKTDSEDMAAIITNQGIIAIIDAAHPYAEQLHKNGIKAAENTNIPYYRYERPVTDFYGFEVEFANSHQEAAETAFKLGRNVLLTTGTRNLKPYAEISQSKNTNLYARVLPCTESISTCNQFGLDNDKIIAEQGPFSTDQNIKLINKYSIDVLVTKDSGSSGGVEEKLSAARACGTKVIVIKRPSLPGNPKMNFKDIPELIKAISNFVENMKR